ncbi:14033_t:CDS:1, partial [Acaulospora morrowiae]
MKAPTWDLPNAKSLNYKDDQKKIRVFFEDEIKTMSSSGSNVP